MTAENPEKEYSESLQNLIERATDAGITHEQFKRIFEESLAELEPQNKPKYSHTRFLIIALLFIITLYFVNLSLDGKPLSLFLCKIQEFIYPGLRLLRILSIPIISTFPSLTELYDETCLIQNPFFRVNDMDCWPCNDVKEISEIARIDEHFQPETSAPFIYKTDQKVITVEALQKLYTDNKKIFDNDAPKLIVNNKDAIVANDFFMKYNINERDSYKWMHPALAVRNLFPRPAIVPRLGQSTERYLMIDNPNSPSYQLPEPECNYVFVVQSSGERLVELQPAKECLNNCQAVSVTLSESYMLWYNWWYWRPVSHSTDGNSTAISYIGSYC
ncbi:uncharacterized protein LOC143911543 isoform X2 [Arctopsyche grandis]|uniref:uncharacterized protein LOC143911543 isoform X2 n=1 Tax=Arctopsyche grandis TaxID=121162 RepID=UPI00406D7038